MAVVAAGIPQSVNIERRTEAQRLRVEGRIAVLRPEIEGVVHPEVSQTAVGGQIRLGENCSLGVDHIETIHRSKQRPTVIETEDTRKMQAAALGAALALKGDAHRGTLPALKVNVQYIVAVIVPPLAFFQILLAWPLLQQPPEAVPGITQAAQHRMVGVGNRKVDALPLATQRIVGCGHKLLIRCIPTVIDRIPIGLPAGGAGKPVGKGDLGGNPPLSHLTFCTQQFSRAGFVLFSAGAEAQRQAQEQKPRHNSLFHMFTLHTFLLPQFILE